MNSNYKLFVITHSDIVPKIKDFENILVAGAYNLNKTIFPNGTLFDDFGLNISKKNIYYSELTGLYWIWKNVTCDIVGLEHYRRFFTFPFFGHYLLSPSEHRVKKKLKKFDIILPISTSLEGKEIGYILSNNAIDEFKYAFNKIQVFFPYMNEAIKQYSSLKHIHMCNMFICAKPIIDEYCEWLFEFLFQLENDDGWNKNGFHKARIYGYISEIFFDLWITYKKLKVYEIGRVDKRKSFISHAAIKTKNIIKGFFS